MGLFHGLSNWQFSLIGEGMRVRVSTGLSTGNLLISLVRRGSVFLHGSLVVVSPLTTCLGRGAGGMHGYPLLRYCISVSYFLYSLMQHIQRSMAQTPDPKIKTDLL